MKNNIEELQTKLLKSAHRGDLEGTAKILLELGETYQKLNMENKALESYENALKLYNKCENTHGEALSIFYIGTIYEKKGKHKNAQRMYKTAAEKFKTLNDTKNQARAIYRHAKISEEQGEFKEALKAYKEYNRLCTLMDDKAKALASYAKINSIEEHLSKHTISLKNQIWPSLIGYIILIFFAETLTAYVNVAAGLGVHILILFVLLIHSSLVSNEKFRELLNSMIILPLIRIVGLSMPIMAIPRLYWFIVISLPLFALAYILIKDQNLEIEDVGLTLKKPKLQFLIGLTGFPLGYLEFMILHPKPLIPMQNFLYLFLGFFILLIFSGLLEELLFRGILQRNSEKLLGALPGLLYASVLFTVCHIQWKSIYELVFVFLIAIFYGYMYQKTKSIIGITFSHGLSNFIVFLLF